MQKAKSMSDSSSQKIIWAVHPFTGERAALRSAARAIRAYTYGIPARVEPVHAWGALTLESVFGEGANLLDELRTRGQEEIDRALRAIPIKTLLPLRILEGPHATLREAAVDLVAYARESGAAMIVLSSHGHKGLKRIFLGSFAETLTLVSDVPVLVVHPGWKRVPGFKTVLFATDFSDESKEAFERILEFAHARKSEVLVYSRAEFPPYLAAEFTLGAYPLFQEAYEAEIERLATEGRKLVEQARDQGLRAHVAIDRSSTGTTASAILRHARKWDALVALGSRSGAARATLLGSTARQVLRTSDRPVWVIHSRRRGVARKVA
jgi:nucleotide-binding universal stress UspA family protein